MKYYAVAFKGWVEIRKAAVRPKRHVTTFVRKGEMEVRDGNRWIPGTYHYALKKVPLTVKLKSVYHEGGSVVATLKTHMLMQTGKFKSLRTGTCLNLTNEQRQVIEVQLGKALS